jgi:hypothetical protein
MATTKIIETPRSSKTEFKLTGDTRMPAATMGRRAVRTSSLIQDKAREVFLERGYQHQG